MISIVVDTHDFLECISMEPNWITICLQICLLSDVAVNSSTLLNTPEGYLLYFFVVFYCVNLSIHLFFIIFWGQLLIMLLGIVVMHLWLHKHSCFGCISQGYLLKHTYTYVALVDITKCVSKQL